MNFDYILVNSYIFRYFVLCAMYICVATSPFFVKIHGHRGPALGSPVAMYFHKEWRGFNTYVHST